MDIFNLGYDAFVAGDPLTAIQYYHQAIAKNEIPDKRLAYVYHYLGLAQYELGRFTLAVESFNQAIQLDNNIDVTYPLRGTAHAVLGNFELAIEDYDRALQHDSSDIQVVSNRGFAWYSLGNNIKAIADFSLALELNPNLPNTYFNRALALYDDRQFEKAVDDLDKVLRFNPNDQAAYSIRANARGALGDFDNAVKDFSAAIEIDSTKYTYFQGRGSALHELGKFDRAISDYNRALVLSPGNDSILRARNISYQDRGDTALAQSDSEIVESQLQTETIDVTPQQPEIKENSESDNETTDDDTAVLENTLLTVSNTDDIETYKKRGWDNYHKKNYQAALKDFKKVLGLKPGDIYRILAVYISAGHLGDNPEVAIHNYIDSGVSRIWPGVIIDYYLGNKPKEAVIQQAYRVGGKRVNERLCEAYYYLGEFHSLKGEKELMREYFQKTLETGVTHFNEFESAKIQLQRLNAQAD